MLEALRGAFRDERVVGEGEPSSSMEALLEGRLAAPEAEALAARVLDDPQLGLELRVRAAMRQARAELGGDAAQIEPAANSSRYRSMLWSGLFAVAAAGLVLVVVRPPSFSNTGTPTLRGEPQAALEPTAPSATLPREAFTLEWTGGPDGATYDLYVTTAELEPVYSVFNLDQREHTLPVSALAEQLSGARLLWRVVAHTPTGRRIHSSAFEVVVR